MICHVICHVTRPHPLCRSGAPARDRRVGTRLLLAVQERASRLRQGHLGRGQLAGRGDEVPGGRGTVIRDRDAVAGDILVYSVMFCVISVSQGLCLID